MSEYSLSLHEVMSMTMRDVHMLMSRMAKRLHNDAAFQANLHGAKMKPWSETNLGKTSTKTEFDAEEDARATRAMQDALMRIRVEKEFAKHGNKNTR